MWSRKKSLPCLLIMLMICLGVLTCQTRDASCAPSEAVQEQESTKMVSIDFSDVDINVFIKFISELTGKNFIVDRRVKGNVTIISPSKISVQEAYMVFESVLNINGFSTVQAGSVIKIMSSLDAKSQNIDTGVRKLYAALSVINSPDKNIITIEDPVEYKLKGIGQIQVNRKIGVTFAKGLRSIVRQDPDVILVGEIRDLETSQVAIQSALTGHLVFSTLHTNDAPSAVTRLVDLGVEPYLITSSVKAVIAQRLVRTLCPKCREPYSLGEGDIKGFRINQTDLVGKTVYRAVGCSDCFNTGYSGRQAIFEIMEVNDALKLVILSTSDANAIKAKALEQGMTLGCRKIILVPYFKRRIWILGLLNFGV